MRDSPHVGDHDQSEAPSASPYLRLPLPLVALVVFAVLAALLGFGLYANANLRPQGAAQPSPPTASPQPTAVPATATPQPLAVPPTALATATPAAAAVLNTVGPTPLVLPPLVGATVTQAPSEPPAAAGPTPLPTVEPALAAEVGGAYENFWRVRSQALLELDPTHLPDVMDGDYLVNATQVIEKLRAEGRAINTKVSLSYAVLSATTEVASVVDDIRDDSVYVTIETHDPISNPVSNQLRILYTLRYISSKWKVVDSVRPE